MTKAVRAMLDFIYKAQFPMHSDGSLKSMEDDLAVFWANVDGFHDNNARDIDHFNISKLYALHHYVHNIHNLGTADNYSTEIGESLHIPMCKVAYRATNRKSYSEQIIRYLVRQESLHLYSRYLGWRNNLDDYDDDDGDEDDDVDDNGGDDDNGDDDSKNGDDDNDKNDGGDDRGGDRSGDRGGDCRGSRGRIHGGSSDKLP